MLYDAAITAMFAYRLVIASPLYFIYTLTTHLHLIYLLKWLYMFVNKFPIITTQIGYAYKLSLMEFNMCAKVNPFNIMYSCKTRFFSI